jgi:hypothetical protein
MYNPTEWRDHIVDPITGAVVQQGTPVTASKLNKIEQGIADAHQLAYGLDEIVNKTSIRVDELTADVLDMRMQYEFDGHARKLGVTANMYWVTFRDIADIDIIAGVYDTTNKKIYLP